MRRKRKIALAVLAVIIVFCLWYTRPRSFDDLVGEGEFQNFSLIATKDSEPSGALQLDSSGGRGETAGALREILQSCQYRVSLRSLFPLPNLGAGRGSGETTILISAATGEDEWFTAAYQGAAAEFGSNGRTIFTRAQDQAIAEKILAFVKEYGQKWETDS